MHRENNVQTSFHLAPKLPVDHASGSSGPADKEDLVAIHASGDLAGQKHCSRRYADTRLNLQVIKIRDWAKRG